MTEYHRQALPSEEQGPVVSDPAQPEGGAPLIRCAEPARHPFRMLLQGVFDGDDLGEGEADDEEHAANYPPDATAMGDATGV